MSKSVIAALRLWPAILGMLIVIAVNRLEHKVMPVVTNFTITEIQNTNGSIHLYGYMKKERDCTFAGVSAKGKNSNNQDITLALVFNDVKRNSLGSRPVGTQEWGPWSMELPLAPAVSEVTLSAVHHCHSLWATSTHLITFPIIKGVGLIWQIRLDY